MGRYRPLTHADPKLIRKRTKGGDRVSTKCAPLGPRPQKSGNCPRAWDIFSILLETMRERPHVLSTFHSCARALAHLALRLKNGTMRSCSHLPFISWILIRTSEWSEWSLPDRHEDGQWRRLFRLNWVCFHAFRFASLCAHKYVMLCQCESAHLLILELPLRLFPPFHIIIIITKKTSTWKRHKKIR